MKRSFVKVARMRIEDVRVGDVINREPDAEIGWFEVNEITTLFNGNVQLADRTELITVSGPFFTIVGVQFVSEAEVPDQPASPLPAIAEEDDTDAEQPDSIEHSEGPDDDLGDQTHAEKGALPSLPTRQSGQPIGSGTLVS